MLNSQLQDAGNNVAIALVSSSGLYLGLDSAASTANVFPADSGVTDGQECKASPSDLRPCLETKEKKLVTLKGAVLAFFEAFLLLAGSTKEFGK